MTAAIEWYKAADNPGFDARGLCEAQVAAYTGDAAAARAAWAAPLPVRR